MFRPIASHRSIVVALAVTAAAGSALLARSSKAVGNSSPVEATPEYYTEHVQPILQANCYRCHAGLNHRGGLHLDTREGLMHGGKDGSVIVPGHPEQSLLVTLIRHEGPANDPKPMPPKSKLTDADIATITEWIRAGAVIPADPAN
ncbi:MAG TPA: c-type cytochrome domain-containing protein [Acidobacteriaceae bacterium]|nr:c-type cytochrome domain-containing protein [Acidobacteriaceae bacterium]